MQDFEQVTMTNLKYTSKTHWTEKNRLQKLH